MKRFASLTIEITNIKINGKTQQIYKAGCLLKRALSVSDSSTFLILKRDQILSERESSASISVLRVEGPLSNLVPQSEQKIASSTFSFPHLEHFIIESPNTILKVI